MPAARLGGRLDATKSDFIVPDEADVEALVVEVDHRVEVGREAVVKVRRAGHTRSGMHVNLLVAERLSIVAKAGPTQRPKRAATRRPVISW